jgi:hypothetical protein
VCLSKNTDSWAVPRVPSAPDVCHLRRASQSWQARLRFNPARSSACPPGTGPTPARRHPDANQPTHLVGLLQGRRVRPTFNGHPAYQCSEPLGRPWLPPRWTRPEPRRAPPTSSASARPDGSSAPGVRLGRTRRYNPRTGRRTEVCCTSAYPCAEREVQSQYRALRPKEWHGKYSWRPLAPWRCD